MILIVSLLLLGGIANSSPTSNEFEECHKFASTHLLYCLNDHKIDNNECWSKSKGYYDSCYKKVYSRHDRRPKKEWLELEKAIEAEEQ